MSPTTTERVHYLRAVGDAMAPLVPDGAAVQVLPDRAPVAGDVVVVDDDGARYLRLLIDWHADPWLVAIRGAAPCALVAPLEVVGVVSQVAAAL